MVATTECTVLFRPESDELRFLPEGPYSAGDGRLSWVAIQHGGESKVGSVNLFDPSTGTNVNRLLPGRPGFAFPTSKPDVFVCGVERSIGLFHVVTGEWSELSGGVDDDVENTIINDGVVYAGNLIFGCKDLKFASRKAGLYLYRQSDQQLIQLRSDQICSNGKAVLRSDSGDLTLIDIDSPSQTITQCSLSIEDGTVDEPDILVDLSDEEVYPDGMIVTPDGLSLIVALYDPGDPEFGVARQYGISSGELEAVWTCPGSPRVTCPQLFAANGKVHLVLTTAVEDMEAEQQSRHSAAGSLFIGDTAFDSVGDQPLFEVVGS